MKRDFQSRNCIWENFLALWNFKAEKSTSRLKYVRNQQILVCLTMHWIKEVEKAESIDELMTSRSIMGRTDFPDNDMLDAMIASALKRLPDKHIHFRKRVSVEEQSAQKYDRFLREVTKLLT